MIKAAVPTIFPRPGTYHVSIAATLLCDTPGVDLYYTTDGSLPTRASHPFDPHRLIMLEAGSDGNKGLTRQVTVRAVAVKNGLQDSDPAEFVFTLARRDRDAYLSREIHPGVWMIQDNDDDKMFLLKGEKKALLIDTGFGTGDLRGYVEKLTVGQPLEVAITHAHPDHIAQIEQFQEDCPVYMHPADLPLAKVFIDRMGFKIDPTRIRPLLDGFIFDLGGTRLKVYAIPGHSPGCISLIDEERGILYAGDCVGSNRAANADSLWMQFEGMPPIDQYLSSLQIFRARLKVKLKEIYTGHNDNPLGEGYMDNLQKAAQKLVDGGLEVLVPSPRPLDAWQTVFGDRLNDPDWAAINVSKEGCLSTGSDKIASLSNLRLAGAEIREAFSPSRFEYSAVSARRELSICATTTSSRCKGLTINGMEAASGEWISLILAAGENQYKIEVSSPDGSTKVVYTLVISCP